jgi:hypothetical protein
MPIRKSQHTVQFQLRAVLSDSLEWGGGGVGSGGGKRVQL